MSTFLGIVNEIDSVSIDRFDGDNLRSTVYFLSHRHWDHMHGIIAPKFKERLRNNDDIFLYCSRVTKVWLESDLYGLGHKIKELPINEEVILTIPDLPPGRDSALSVTLLPAGHCPGSVMFFFSWESKHILYTGDIRLEIRNLERMKTLKNISLDTLYLDTTFYSPSYGYLPSRAQSMSRLVHFCKEWLDSHEDNIIDIRRPAKIGIECVYIDLFQEMGTHIHVSKEEWEQYGRIPDLAKVITCDPSKARIHACVDVSRKVGKNVSVTEKFQQMHGNVAAERIRTVKLCVLSARNLSSKDDIVKYDCENNFYRLVYSSHCSHSELKEIVSFLSPRKIVPCVVYDMSAQEIVDALQPPVSPISIQTSSFESTVDLSPVTKSNHDEPPVQSCSQSSINSISSTEDTSTQLENSANAVSRRYAVPESSDDEINASPAKTESSNGRWSFAHDRNEEQAPWAKYMSDRKKPRRE